MLTIVELCAGSAAVSTRALGYRYPLLTYMGGKAKWARRVLDALGVAERPSRVLLVDPGPWGDTWAVLSMHREEVAERLQQMVGSDPHEAWGRLREEVPACPVERAAAHLALQVWNWRNKPIGRAGDSWTGVAGFSRTTAYGLPPTPHFGAVKPQLPRLLAKLRAMDLSAIEARQCSAVELEPIPGAVVYIDPPYQGTTGYGHDLTRAEVLETVYRWASAGCTVAVSEAEPLLGGHAVALGARASGALGPRKKRPEWLTVYGAEAATRVQLSMWMEAC